MKFNKISTVVAGVAALLATASCEPVTDPVLQTPDTSTFLIYAPTMQDQYIELTEDGTFDLVLSGQPSYGFSAVTQYRVQVSLDDKFTDQSPILTPSGTGTQSRMTLSQLELAEALCELHGFTSPDNYVDQGEERIYFRGVAYIDGVDGTWVTTSNSTSLNRVQSFFSVAKPGVIYVIGNYAGDWIAPNPNNAENLIPYSLSEKDDEVRSKIYYGTVGFTGDNCIFRFYTSLDGADSGWDRANSVGPEGGPDDDKLVTFADFKAGSELVQGITTTKDSFEFPNYAGTLSFVVDLNAKTASIKAVE